MIAEKLTAVVPEEPPPGSVVVDSGERAWQRITSLAMFGADGQQWVRACRPGNEPMAVNWAYLLSYGGPVTLVYRGIKEQ